MDVFPSLSSFLRRANKRRPVFVLIEYRITGMKRKIGILLAVLAAMAPIANAVIVNVEVGDRPYYIHGPATTLVGFTGFGFRDIGVGGTITASGSTAITHHAKSAHLLVWDVIRITPGPELLRQGA